MISILVPNWCSGGRLRALLASVPRDGPAVEVLVCDNGSDDGSAEGLPAAPGLRVERTGRNLGFAGAVNLLARHAKGEVLLVLNPDCTLLPDTLPALGAFRKSHPDVPVVGLCLVGADGIPQPRYAPRPLPTLSVLLAEVLGAARLSGSAAVGPAAAGSTAPAEHLAGAALAIEAVTFARLGGMDEGFWPAWFEDVDLSRRVRDAGLAAWFCAEARVVHEGGYTRERLGYAGLLPLYYGNLLRYGRKHMGAGAALLLRVAMVTGMAIRCVAVAVAPGAAGTPRREAWRAFGRVAAIALGSSTRGAG